MNEWTIRTIKESSIEIIDGDRGVNYPKKEDLFPIGFCLFLNTGNVTKSGFDFENKYFILEEKDKKLRKGKLKRNDIVLTTRGTVGNVGFFNKKIIYDNIRINSGMVIMRADENKIYPYYLYLLLRSKLFKSQALKQGSGSAQPQLPIQSLNNISFPWFNLPTQKAIAKVLSDLDAKIELNNKINQELEAMAKTLYDYWFVQFDFPCLPSDYRPSGQVNPNIDLAQKIKSVCTYRQTGGLPLPDGKKWFVYVILCQDGTFYKGITNDLYRRYYEHKTGQGAEWTKVHIPKKIIHYEEFETQQQAEKREKELKTGFGRTWLKREYDKFLKYGYPSKNGFPAHQTRLMMAGKMVYNEELKREIPEGWEVKLLKEIAKTGSGGTPLKSKKEYYENANIPWINSGEVNASFIISAKKYISELGLNNSSAKLFEKGTILMAMYGATAGQVSLIDFEACTNQAICGINPIDKQYTSYIKFSLEDMYQYLINLSTGSARDNLSQDKIKELNIVIPNEELLIAFHKVANSNLEKILLNLKQNQQLTELRDWLLPMLMNGQVVVEN